MGRMKKKEAIAIIEATLRQQAATGTVSSKLVEQLVTIRGWSGKAKAARAKARAGKAIVQPDEVPLPELIKEAREQVEEASQPSPQPAAGPALQPRPQPSPASPPPGVKRGALDILLGITEPAAVEQPASIPPPPPAVLPSPPPAPPQPRPVPQVYFASHLELNEPDNERPAGYSDSYF